MYQPYASGFWLYFTLGISGTSYAALIDFETVPGGAPADKLAISTQYQADFGVTFSLQGGGTPFLEKTGGADSGHGFWNEGPDIFDTEAVGYEGGLGDYFLRFGTTTFSDTPGPILIITYDTPVSAASAEIWDIDAATAGTNGWEAWTISARDMNDTVIDTIVSPDGIDESLATSMNAKPWTWSFNHTSEDIYSIAINFSGTADKVGLAFDNFSPATAAVPIPAAIWLFASGLTGLIGIARAQRRFEV